MKEQHTPTPWHRNAYNICSIIKINNGADADGHTYIDGRHQVKLAVFGTAADAEFAVRAANMHQPMLEALMMLHPTIACDAKRAEIGKLIMQAQGMA